MIKSINLEICNKCNLKCLHCFYKDKINKNEMSLEKINFIIKKLPHLDNVVITGGEPLLHSKIYQVLELFGKSNKITFIITTNGTVFDKEILSLFRKYCNIKFQVSLDSSNAAINDIIRGKNSYEKVLDNLNQLSTIDSNRVRLHMTVNALNYANIKEVYDFGKQLNIIPEFTFVAKMGNAIDNWNILKMSDAQKLFVYSTISELYNCDRINLRPPSVVKGCTFDESYTVNTSGNIYVCSYFPYDYIGNIFSQSTGEIQKNHQNNELINKIKLWQTKVYNKHCIKCSIRHKCSQGCYGSYISNLNQVNNSFNDGFCNFRKLKYIYKYFNEQ